MVVAMPLGVSNPSLNLFGTHHLTVSQAPSLPHLVSFSSESSFNPTNDFGSSSSSDANNELMKVSKQIDWDNLRIRERKERKEEVNRKIASRKAISVILRREATKSLLEMKKGSNNSKKLHPRTVLEALHERITSYRWESALKVFELMRDQMWYKPNPGIYVKLIVMLGKCKQPEKAYHLFQAMIDEGCLPTHETYTALLSAYSRSGYLTKAFFLLEEMKDTPGCEPDVHTYTILIKSCLHILDFEKALKLLADMVSLGIKPNVVTYNTLIDSYGKAKMFQEMEATLLEMLDEPNCEPDVWTMNSTLRAFGSSGQIDMMEKCYEKFQGAGIEPNIKTFNILLDSYGKARYFEKMSAVMEFMQQYHFAWTIVTYNVLIDAFGRAGDLKQMEFMFRLMRSERIIPSCVTFCSLIRAYMQAEKPEKIQVVLRMIENSDVVLDTAFFNCLVNAYEKLGSTKDMDGVLELMEQKGCKPDRLTYKTMIKAYSAVGMTTRVKELSSLLGGADLLQSPRKRPDF